MSKTPHIKYTPWAGTSINEAIDDALTLSNKYNRIVDFNFNGMRVKVNKRLSPKHILNQWHERTHASHLRYLESDRYKQYQTKRNLEIVAKQATVDIFMENIDGFINNLDDLMEQLKPFVECSDDVGVKIPIHDLIVKLENGGYMENEGVGNDPEWFNTRSRLGRYIIGQILGFLHNGNKPHPMTSSFIEKYFNLTSE